MKVTILGAGNMGGAMARSFVASGMILPEDITVTAKHSSTLQPFSELGIRTSLDNREAVSGSDVVFIAVKPWLVKEVVEQIKDNLDLSVQLIACVAAGIQGKDLLSWLDKGDGVMPSLVYIIPNTAIEVLESMTFIAPVSCSQEQTAMMEELFGKTGSAIVTDEVHLKAGTALASCGIAYAFRYIRAAAEGGVELGFRASDAAHIVAQTVKGAASLLEAHKSHPEVEIDKVTTPGGITIKGLNEMERNGFTNAVISGLKATGK